MSSETTPSFDLRRFTLGDMIECGRAIRSIGEGASSMEEVAERAVRYIYQHMRDRETGAQNCALVRFFLTRPFADLDPELQGVARGGLEGKAPVASMKCLTLLATAGDLDQWNSRHTSAGHRAIPLPSSGVVAQAPMISQLISQLGVPITAVLEPSPDILLDLSQRKFNVFYVPDAKGSPDIPAQDQFVIPFGIDSVLGCGGMLPTGDLYALILFSKVPIARETAEGFQTLALDLKLAVLPFATSQVFAGA